MSRGAACRQIFGWEPPLSLYATSKGCGSHKCGAASGTTLQVRSSVLTSYVRKRMHGRICWGGFKGQNIVQCVRRGQVRVHASTNVGEETSAPAETPGEGVASIDRQEAEHSAEDTEKSRGRNVIRRRASSSPVSDWIASASDEAYDRWLAPVDSKKQGLPLVAVVGLTAGSLVLAIVLFLQGWSKMRHRVPSSFKLPISSSSTRSGAPETVGTGNDQGGERGTQTSSPASLAPVQQESVLEQEIAGSHKAESTESLELEKGQQKEQSIAEKLQHNEVKEKSGERSHQLSDQYLKKSSEERVDGDNNLNQVENAQKLSDQHLKSSSEERVDVDNQLNQVVNAQKPSDQPLKSSSEERVDAVDDSKQVESVQDHQKDKASDMHAVVSQSLRGGEELASVERSKSAGSEDEQDKEGVLVLQPALSVFPLKGGDGRRAPPSSPTLIRGQSWEHTEESKATIPAGILQAAADSVMHQARQLVDFQGQDAVKEDSVDEEPGEDQQNRKNVQTSEAEESAPRETRAEKEVPGSVQESVSDEHLVHEPAKAQLPSLAKGPESEAQDAPSLSASEPSPTGDDESRSSLAGGNDATAQQPPARGEPADLGPDSRGSGSRDSFQEWYAKQKSGGKASKASVSKQRPVGELKPSTYVDTTHVQALQALQKLNVVEKDVDPAAVCSKRDFARWLLSGSRVLSGSSTSRRVFPVPGDGVTEAAYDDVKPDDKDFAVIQGLAEAGIIPSRLSSPSTSLFHPDEPLSRQELVRWKYALERRRLPAEEDPGKAVFESWGFTDLDLIDTDALPAILADFQAEEQSVIGRAFGYTLRFQPQKWVSVAQAASALAAGSASEVVSERVSEMEVYRAADEVILEEAREQREIIEAVAARGEELAKHLEEDRGALEETRKSVEEALKELEEHQATIRKENEQLAQSVDEARFVILELASVRSISESERDALQAELKKLTDQRTAVERATSEAEEVIGAEIKRARAAVEGLGGVREVLLAGTEGRVTEGRKGEGSAVRETAGSGDASGKPLVEFFDEKVESAGGTSRNGLKNLVRVAKKRAEVARKEVAHLTSNMRSRSADAVGSLRERTSQVAKAGSDFVQDVPDRLRQGVPQGTLENVEETLKRIRDRVERLLLLAWETLLRLWNSVLAVLQAGTERAKDTIRKVQSGRRGSAA